MPPRNKPAAATAPVKDETATQASPAVAPPSAAPVATPPEPAVPVGTAKPPAPAKAAESELSQAAQDVLTERARQQDQEGYDAATDDAHTAGELARASACYMLRAAAIPASRSTFSWPFSPATWKPSDRRRDLVKGLALGLAELERIDRTALDA